MNYQLFLTAFRQKYGHVKDARQLRSALREELQLLILEVLFRHTTFPIFFMGATQLRLSYQLDRYSEDLDFSLEAPHKAFPGEKFFEALEKGFAENITGFRVHLRKNTKRTVLKAIIAFSQVLYDLGLAPMENQTMKIKVELDTNPPAHATTTKRSYQSLFSSTPYFVHAFDLETSFAGKLGAVLEREYQKGRDYFDLKWYLERKPRVAINLDYFNANAKQQNRPTFSTISSLLKAVEKKVKGLDLGLMQKDLDGFVMMPAEFFQDWLKRYQEDTLALLSAYQKQQ